MARKIVYLNDPAQAHRPFAEDLSHRGYSLVWAVNDNELGRMIADQEFELVVFAQGSPGQWQLVKDLIARLPQVPILCVVNENDSRVQDMKCNEVRQAVPTSADAKSVLELADQLARVGRLYRQLNERPLLAEGSNAIDQMYQRLDVHHILDRSLSYFGRRLELTNLHWFRWGDFAHLLSGDHESLALEMEMANLRSPRMMSYNEADLTDILHTLWQSLTVNELEKLNLEKFRLVRVDSKDFLYVMVHSLTDGSPMGVILLEGVRPEEAESLALQVLGTLHLMARFIEFGLSHWDTQAMSMKDELTVLYNQRFLPIVLETEINRAARREQNFSILFLDLDFFKMVNDTRGHWIGSKLLKEVGLIIFNTIRSCDYGFRYGGDEFVVVLPETDISGGQVVAERIRKLIESTPFLIDGQEIRLTASIGLAAYPAHGKSKEQLIQLADQAMYYGKRKSRNIVYIAS